MAGPEADLDTQFAFGLTYPTPGTFYSTGGSPPFNPDVTTTTNTNEPYDNVGESSLYPRLGLVLTPAFGITYLVVAIHGDSP